MLQQAHPPHPRGTGRKGLLALSVAALSTSLTLAPVAAHAAPYAPPEALEAIESGKLAPGFQQEFVDLVDQDRVYSHVQELSVGIGPRVAGTAAEDAAQDYVEQHLQEYGFQTSREVFDGRTQFIANVVPSRDLPGIASWQYRSAQGARVTGPSAPLSAPVIDLGDGSGLAATEVSDALVIVDWNADAEARTALLEQIAAAGAAGIILAQTNPTGSVPNLREVPSTVADLVVVTAGGVQSARLRELAASPGEPLSLSITTEQTRDDSSNVIGVRPASNDDGTAPIIYVGAHVDSVVGSPGASDNASGIGIMLETAKLISNYSLDTEIRVGSWGGEEIGILGSAHHAQSLSEDEIQRTIGAWNMDMAGTAEKGTDEQPFGFWGLSVNPDNESNTVLSFADDVHGDLQQEPLNIGYVGRSDHQSFHDVGINAAVFSWMFWSADSSIVLEPHYHLPSDTIEFVSADRMGFSAQVIGGSAFRAAMNPVTVNVTDETGAPADGAQLAMSCEGDNGWREVPQTSQQGSSGTFAPHTTCDFAAVGANGAIGASLDEDIAGDTTVEVELVLDENKPEISIGTEEQAGPSGWFTSAPVTVNVSATDETDDAPAIEVSRDGQPWEAYTEPLSITEDGEHALQARATDGAGNSASAETLVKLDTQAPELEASAVAEHRGQLRLEVADATSGLGAIEYRLDAQEPWSTLDTEEDGQGALLGEVEVGQEAAVVELRASDVAGNTAAPVSVQIPAAQDGTQPSPTPGDPQPVPEDPNPEKDLARTGANLTLALSAVALLLLGAGGGLFAVRRRRSATHRG